MIFSDNLVAFLTNYYLFAALTLWPVGKIFKRTGHSQAYAFALLVPLLGMLVVTATLAFTPWPNFPKKGPKKSKYKKEDTAKSKILKEKEEVRHAA